MDLAVSLESIANVTLFIAPGYFAMQVYSLIYAKRDRDFSRLVVESIVYSLPLVALANVLWERLLGLPQATALSGWYVLFLLMVSLGAGALFTFMRTRWPLQQLAARLGFGSPNEDFVKTQLNRIDQQDSDNNVVLVTLKSGKVFSGTIDRLSRYSPLSPNYYYFTNLAWLDEEKHRWVERDGGIIVERGEIEYIETPVLTQ